MLMMLKTQCTCRNRNNAQITICLTQNIEYNDYVMILGKQYTNDITTKVLYIKQLKMQWIVVNSEYN
jgi:hypothetical protein